MGAMILPVCNALETPQQHVLSRAHGNTLMMMMGPRAFSRSYERPRGNSKLGLSLRVSPRSSITVQACRVALDVSISGLNHAARKPFQGGIGRKCTRMLVMSATKQEGTETDISPKASSAGAIVAAAKTCEELLRAADVLILPGEETIFWQKQDIHHQRRQVAATHALRRLAKMLCGAGLQEQRQELVATEEFSRLCQCAAIPSPDHSPGDDTSAAVGAAAEALRALGSLAPLPADAVESADMLQRRVSAGSNFLPPAQLSGCLWACSRIGLEIDARLGDACAPLRLPFRIVPGLTSGVVRMEDVVEEVPFQAELLMTRDGKKVKERRETCWMAEPGIGGLAYSGKIMDPVPFTPLIRKLRDTLHTETGQYFDCALLNLYPDEDTACKWHADPDMGRLWARDSIVVSIGETRRFNFRQLSNDGKVNEDEPHSCRVFDGDCIWMFDDCNDAYHHCVMRSEGDGNKAARASVVFKRALPDSKGNKGHGARHHVPDKSKQQRSGPANGSAGRGRGGGRQGQSYKGRGGGRGRPSGRGAGHKRVGRPSNV